MANKLLLPLHLSHKAHLGKLLDIARKFSEGETCEIHLLYVDQSRIHAARLMQLDKKQAARYRQEAIQILNELQSQTLAGVALHCHYREGVSHDEILLAANELNVDAIMIMASRPGLHSYFIGSTAERVVRHASCSVFVIRDDQIHN